MSSTILDGSLRERPAGAARVGDVAPQSRIQFTLVLRRSGSGVAEPDDVEAVRTFAEQNDFTVVQINEASRTIELEGNADVVAKTLGAQLECTSIGGKHYRTRHGAIHLPAMLADRVIAVLGIDERPAATSYQVFQSHAQGNVSYTPRQLAAIYQFPEGTGTGQTIGIIELGGGFRQKDLERYWKSLGIAPVKTTAIAVKHGANRPTGDFDGPDGEVLLDIEVAGGVAPGANLAIYFAPNTDEGFLAALNAAIHDKKRKPSVISISWGAPEEQWTPQAVAAFNGALQDASLLGITVCCASGDNGSSDGVSDGKAHVDFPASSPWALACGGTTLHAVNQSIESETVWNDGRNGGATGGGVSSLFARPAYQASIAVPGASAVAGRGVPDVAAVADPQTGYTVLVDGTWGVVGGTSAVAPLWAGLIAILNEALGKPVGFLHPLLYDQVRAAKGFNDVLSGTNEAYRAGAGWDACTGLGSPNGIAILRALQTVQ